MADEVCFARFKTLWRPWCRWWWLNVLCTTFERWAGFICDNPIPAVLVTQNCALYNVFWSIFTDWLLDESMCVIRLSICTSNTLIYNFVCIVSICLAARNHLDLYLMLFQSGMFFNSYPLNKMAAISQPIFSDAFSWLKCFFYFYLNSEVYSYGSNWQ